MTLNQLYHDHGVAQTRARHADASETREGHAADALLIGQRIKRDRSHHVTAVKTGDRFEIFRAEEVQVTSTKFSGGDWRWRLADCANETLVDGQGYQTENECMKAVALLRDRAFSAS